MTLNEKPNLLAAGTVSAHEMQVVRTGHVAPMSGAQN